MRIKNNKPVLSSKALTGIQGLDEVTFGGLPRERSTLVCGGPGCGKTLLAMEFILNGAIHFNEPGIFIAFEESEQELAKNFSSLGYDIAKLEQEKKVIVDHIHIDRNEIEETGEYNLDGLFIRIQDSIETIGAKRIALDTLEVLFGGLSNLAILRSELSRLFRWLKDRGLTVIVTAEKGDQNSLTRFGIEEYVSDCVIILDHRVTDEIPIRRLRILKYRGSAHGTNEYPYLIDEDGISLQPITSLLMNHNASTERIPTGIPGLDAMMGGEGFYRGSSILVTGMAGTGKSSVAAHFAVAGCARGERVLYFAFEESPSQIQRNMRSIGLDFGKYVQKGLMQFHSSRPTVHGLEMHLVSILKKIVQFKPNIVIIDPITSLMQIGSKLAVHSLLIRLVDHLKVNHITSIFTSLSKPDNAREDTEAGVSSLMDTWIYLRSQESGGMRDHGMYILKSRGMAHSNGIRQFRFSAQGIELQ